MTAEEAKIEESPGLVKRVTTTAGETFDSLKDRAPKADEVRSAIGDQTAKLGDAFDSLRSKTPTTEEVRGAIGDQTTKVSDAYEQVKGAIGLRDYAELARMFEEWLPTLNISGSKVYPHDIDGDGDQDLLLTGRHIPWSYPDPESSILLLNNGSKFENKTTDIAPELKGIGMVNDATWVDFNMDGMIDLVVAGEWMPVSFFQNENGKFRNVTSELGLDKNSGWWFSIESADMDGDGDNDLIAGNFAL